MQIMSAQNSVVPVCTLLRICLNHSGLSSVSEELMCEEGLDYIFVRSIQTNQTIYIIFSENFESYFIHSVHSVFAVPCQTQQNSKEDDTHFKKSYGRIH